LNDPFLERLFLAVPSAQSIWKLAKRLARNDSLTVAYGVK